MPLYSLQDSEADQLIEEIFGGEDSDTDVPVESDEDPDCDQQPSPR